MGDFFDWTKLLDKEKTPVKKLEKFFKEQGLIFPIEIYEIYDFGKKVYDRVDDINDLTKGQWTGYFNTTGYYALFFAEEQDAMACKLIWT